jgi:hypothetical protein
MNPLAPEWTPLRPASLEDINRMLSDYGIYIEHDPAPDILLGDAFTLEVDINLIDASNEDRTFTDADAFISEVGMRGISTPPIERWITIRPPDNVAPDVSAPGPRTEYFDELLQYGHIERDQSVRNARIPNRALPRHIAGGGGIPPGRNLINDIMRTINNEMEVEGSVMSGIGDWRSRYYLKLFFNYPALGTRRGRWLRGTEYTIARNISVNYEFHKSRGAYMMYMLDTILPRHVVQSLCEYCMNFMLITPPVNYLY